MKKLAVVGLGYVGLPLAVEFAKHYSVVGFDINQARIIELQGGIDRTHEVDKEELLAARDLHYTDNLESIRDAQIFIITVPTPIDSYKKPNLTPLFAATKSVGSVLKRGDIVIYESTVYPGCTEEECVPLLEQKSGLKFNQDFFCGYSPERINPGDREHRLSSIKKVTSGSTPEAADEINALYASIIQAGTHMASSIRVAEAAKVIENAQRDINIAFVNELAMIFEKMGIDTLEVLEAAGTKWNFLPFRPGLVGGHCIGVDPYYLTYKAESLGHHPQIILAGRRINDEMGRVIAHRVTKLMARKGQTLEGARVLILGITFKENCPDIRNSRVVDIIEELAEFGCQCDVYDPLASAHEVVEEYGISMRCEKEIFAVQYQAVVLAVAHQEFRRMDLRKMICQKGVVYDVKGVLERDQADGRL